ncbi:ATP-grasp domain-containing protein [Bradyrhizobium sp.]|uniref:ATP-grasp domain-containing protein n=1 Tax=Bradyrhizobium sp. TaxID=376 RepID=UPI003C744B51
MVERPTVLVTGLGSYGEQILKALRQPEAAGCRIVGTDTDPFCIHFALVDEAVVLPRADAPEYVEAVLAVCARFGVAAVFPGCEPDLDRLSGACEEFRQRGILWIANPQATIELCRDKLVTGKKLAQFGFEPPKYELVRDAGDLAKIDWYPLVVKPRTAGGGSKDCYIAQSRRELELLLEYVGNDVGLFAQEYVGTPESEFTVGVLLDLDGNLINSIALRRELVSQLNLKTSVVNKSSRAQLGKRLVISSGVSQGEIGSFPEVTEPCEKLAVAIGAAGAINVQCRLVDGKIKVFEINPRFSGTTFIRAMMGYNEPDTLVRRHLLGQTIEPHFAYRHGRVRRSLRESIVAERPARDWRQLADEQ